MRRLARRILVAGWGALLLGACLGLWVSRPQLATIADRGAAGLLGVVAWSGGVLLVAGLAMRLLVRDPRRRAASLPIHNLQRHTNRKPGKPQGGYAARAFPIIPTGTPLSADDRLARVEQSGTSAVRGRTVREPQRPLANAAVSLLGPPVVSLSRRRGRGLRGGTRELLFYLALHPGGAQRDRIIDALWPTDSPERARKRLWRAAADVRAQLGETSLHRDGEQYWLNRDEVSVDLDQLEHALDELGRSGDESGQLPRLEQTLALFRDDPLAGADFPWAESERRRLHAARLDLLERTGRALLAEGDAAGALSRVEEGLAGEPYNEQLSRLAMQAEAALGSRGAVIERYEQLRVLLEERLGLQPQLQTRRLYRQLLGQDHEHEPASTGR